MHIRGLSAQTLSALGKAASRHSRVAHEAEDVVQDVLLAAVERGLDVSGPCFLPWALGAIRNRAMFMARTSARRRQRETVSVMAHPAEGALPRFPEAFVSSLPPARRVMALLVNLGLGRAEIAHLLGIGDMAFRQRLSGLRKDFAATGGAADGAEPLPHHPPDGIARRALRQALRTKTERAFAVRDPDGIPIFFSRRDHVSPSGGN